MVLRGTIYTDNALPAQSEVGPLDATLRTLFAGAVSDYLPLRCVSHDCVRLDILGRKFANHRNYRSPNDRAQPRRVSGVGWSDWLDVSSVA